MEILQNVAHFSICRWVEKELFLGEKTSGINAFGLRHMVKMKQLNKG